MSLFGRLLPPLVVACGAAYLIAMMVPERDRDGEMQIREAARVPVYQTGRIRPLDTVARTALAAISNRDTFVDGQGRRQPAIRWLLDVMSTSVRDEKDNPAEEYEIFRIENDQVRGLLGLEERPGLRYAIRELKDKIQILDRQFLTAKNKQPAVRDAFDNKVLELAEHLQLYLRLRELDTPLLVPPQSADDQWQTFHGAVHAQAAAPTEPNADARSLLKILQGYAQGRTASFNRDLADYRERLLERYPEESFSARFETFYNSFAPFYQCCVLYVAVFLLAALGWLSWWRPLWRAAFWLLALVLIVHSFGLLSRIYIQWLPPITNLYSSALFIGWAAVIFGLGLEAIFRNGIGTALSAFVGAVTLLIASNLVADGDTMEPMRAVLNTPFWLATHVTVVALGYMATFMAGGLGIAFIFGGVFTPYLNKDASKRLGSMIYGTLCFATLFSFVGTVLGGIWADQSWGRFWGWDPKENGALLIVIWNALVLHARWGGLVRQRGVAALAVFGNIVTSWSWFGVNMLGVGLHSYGFMESAAFWLGGFVISQLLIIAIGLLPRSLWWSYLAQENPPPPTGRPMIAGAGMPLGFRPSSPADR